MTHSTDSPRPSSLRAIVAWFFVLSFADYPDDLKARDPDLESTEGDLQAQFRERMGQLLWWPPDVFALTAAVLSRTGAYRMVVGPRGQLGKKLWQRLDWQSRTEAHAEAWRSVISEMILQPQTASTIRRIKNIKKTQPVTDKLLRDKLRIVIKDRCERRDLEYLDIPSLENPQPGAEAQNLFDIFIRDITELKDEDGLLANQNLLAVSVKADRLNRPGITDDDRKKAEKSIRFFEAIIGLHILADAAAESIGVPRSSTQESAVFDAFANIMLSLRGSLSTVSKMHGLVLPKMRTPQSGLTIRNLSHNLTFHDCEVEVMWRSFPWSNFDENTLNILYVPYPFEFNPNRFKSETDNHESVGYFTYDPGEWEEVGCVVKLIKDVRESGIQPHMLVFTETAFNDKTYKRLLTKLSHEFESESPQSMPVVVAGISRKEGKFQYNELRLATYFAGKWYQLSQQKHHRWQLNASQIRQYGLQGHLSTARPLFERSVINQRRLTFYAPAPWLVLSPLICEDLSRIEPVSELIRGVGPTLVLALLLDGPQLADRWPGRYASVLADDPGTGVLTVTSYGIAQISRPENEIFMTPSDISNKEASSDDVVVASWKDSNSSFQKLSVSKNNALLLTLTANLGEEFTLDNRGIKGKAAGFRLDGIKSFKLTGEPKKTDDKAEEVSLGNWSDIREITALTYVASAALSLLRPHRSKHPTEPEKRTDTWETASDWETRCRRVRQLINVMLGRDVFIDNDKWKQSLEKGVAELENDLKANPGTGKASEYYYLNELKAVRKLLLDNIFEEGNGIAPNRHLFAVLGFAQSTIDVEVRDNEAIWPTDTLRFGGLVLRILLDSIAGLNSKSQGTGPNRKKLNREDYELAGKVYCARLRIAGRANRGEDVLWDSKNVKDDRRDVDQAPKPLLTYPIPHSQSTGEEREIFYLGKFKSEPGTPKFPTVENYQNPNRYDFFRMVLELVDAILTDEESSLWKRCQNEFDKTITDNEMRRLTLLILMMLPALINEQLQYDNVRLKQNTDIGLSTNVLHDLMEKSERILKQASQKTILPLQKNES